MKNKLSDLSPRDSKLTGFYRGIVEDRNDPEKLGRVRIRVFGVHTDEKTKTPISGVPTEELPWAEPLGNLVEGGVSGFGFWSVPLQGAQVLVYFEESNHMKPRFMASLSGRPIESSKGKTNGFNDPDGKYPIDSKNSPHEPNEINENDMHKLATGDLTDDTIVKSKNDSKITGVTTATGASWDEPDSYYKAQYPDNIVFASHSGMTIEVDNTSGEERLHIYHPSNSYIEISAEGDMVIRNAKNKFEMVDDNKKTKIQGNSDKTTCKNKTDYIKMNLDEKTDLTKTETVGIDKLITIGNDRTEGIGNNETVTVGTNKEVTVMADKIENVGMNKTEIIGMNQTEFIGINETVTVGANKTETIGANKTEIIAGVLTITAGGLLFNITGATGGAAVATSGVPISLTAPTISLN